MPRKSDFQCGLETVLNNPQTSFLKNPTTFNEIQKQSAMSIGAMLKHVGKTSRSQKNGKPKEPTDAERAKARIDTMEQKSIE